MCSGIVTVAIFFRNSLYQFRSESVLEICRLTLIPVLGILGNALSEFSSMCSEYTIVVTGVRGVVCAPLIPHLGGRRGILSVRPYGLHSELQDSRGSMLIHPVF